MRILAVVFALLLVIPAAGSSFIAAMGLYFPPLGALGLLLVAMVAFQLKACLRLWNGDYGPILPGEKNAFGGGALVSTIMLTWIFSMGVEEGSYRFLVAAGGLLLTSALLPITLTTANKRYSVEDDSGSGETPREPTQ